MAVSFDPATGSYSGGSTTAKAAAPTTPAVYFDPATGSYSKTPPPVVAKVVNPVSVITTPNSTPGNLQGGPTQPLLQGSAPNLQPTARVQSSAPVPAPVAPPAVLSGAAAPIAPAFSLPISQAKITPGSANNNEPLVSPQQLQPTANPQGLPNQAPLKVTGVDGTKPPLPTYDNSKGMEFPSTGLPDKTMQADSDEFNYRKSIIQGDMNPKVAGFVNAFETSTIGGKVLNLSNPSQADVKSQLADQYSQEHPNLSLVAKGLGVLTDTILLGKLGAGFGLESKVTSAAGGLADLVPTATRVIGKGIENASIFGIQSFLNEGLDQIRQGKFQPGKLAADTAGGAAFGAATGGAGGTSSALRQVAYVGAGVAGLTTLEKYIQNGKITGKDLVQIGVNATVAMLFQAVSGRGSADEFKTADAEKLSFDKEINDIQSRSGGTYAEAKQVAGTMRALSYARITGQPMTPELLKSAMNGLLDVPVKPSTEMVKILEQIPASFESLPANQKVEIIFEVSEKVSEGESMEQAIHESTRSLPDAGVPNLQGFQAPNLTPMQQISQANAGNLTPFTPPAASPMDLIKQQVQPTGFQAPTASPLEQIRQNAADAISSTESSQSGLEKLTSLAKEIGQKYPEDTGGNAKAYSKGVTAFINSIGPKTSASIMQELNKHDSAEKAGNTTSDVILRLTEIYNKANAVTPDAKLSAQEGSVNPGQAFSDIQESIKKFQDDIKDSRAGEALRVKYVGNEAARVVKDNHLFDDMEKLVKAPLEQEALNLYRNFKDDPGGLEKMLNGTHSAYQEAIDFYKSHNPKATEADIAAFHAGAIKDVQKFLKPIQMAMNPSESIVKADAAYSEFAKSHLAEGKELGFLESSIAPENYTPGMTTPAFKPRGYNGKVSGGKLGGKFSNSMERTFKTPLHAVIAGAMPKTINAVTVGRIYAQRHAAQAATVEFLQELEKIQLASFNDETAPADWEVVKIGARKTIYLPKKIADALRPLLEKNPDMATLEKITKFQVLIKAGEVSASVFHLKALGITAVSNMGPTAAVKANFADVDTQWFREGEIDSVKHGGTTSEQGKTAEAFKMANKGTVISRMDMLRATPGLAQVLEYSDYLTYITFDLAQRKYKVIDYMLQRDAWMVKHPDATPEELFNQKVAIAKDVNATYGGLNLDALGVKQFTRRMTRLLFFAPDWTYSNILKGKYVFTNKGNKWKALQYFIYSAVLAYAASQAASLLFGKKLSKHPFKVYLGKDKNGKEIYSNWFAVGAFGDFVNWLSNMNDSGVFLGTAQTIGNKMASLPRSIVHLITGKNWLGQTIAIKGGSPLVNTALAAKEVLSENIPAPFGLIDSIKYVIDEKTARSFWDYASAVVAGSSTTHEVPKGSHVPTSGIFKGQVVGDGPGVGSNRPLQSLWQQFKTGKLYLPKPKGGSSKPKKLKR